MSDNNNDNSLLDPQSSPVAHKPVGVKRVNNWPLIMVGGGLGIFLFVIMLVGIDRAEQQEEANKPKVEKRDFARDSSSLAKEISSGYENGYIPSSDEVKTEETKSQEVTGNNEQQYSPEVAAIINEGDKLPNQQSQSNTEDERDKERAREVKRRIEQARLRRLEEAMVASTSIKLDTKSGASSSSMFGAIGSNGNPTFQGGNSRNAQLEQLAEVQRKLDSTNAMLSADPIASYQAQLASLKAAGLGGDSSSQSVSADTPMAIVNDTSKDELSQFAGDGTGNRWRLNTRMETPKPYEIKAGFVIPGIMITGINSDLPGQIMAQVSQNVFDTATGRYLLIPQGSRLVGMYSSKVAYGQDRVMIAWQRIVFPDGKALDIGGMQGADAAGYSGFKDQVNHHFWRIFGSAFMMSVITAGVELSQDDSNSTGQNQSTSSALSQALGQQLGQAAARMIMKNLNIAPTIEIRPGYRFNVMISKDINLNRPYQAFDY